MIRVLLVAVVFMCSTATAQEWQTRDGVAVYHARVEGRGTTMEQARQSAFQLAVEMAVGSLITREVEINNGQVDRNAVINYSSGFVHAAEEISSRRQGRDIVVTMDVWVRRSDIADRILHQSRASTDIPGSQIDLQHQSLVAERERGDAVLRSVTRDYPERAYDISVSAVRTYTGSHRELGLEIDLDLGMNSSWLTSFSEALLHTATHRDAAGCVRNPYRCGWPHVVGVKYRASGDFFIKGADVAYDDHHRAEIMRAAFSDTNPHIQIRIHDGFGNTGFLGCFSHPELTRTNYMPARRFVSWQGERTIIDGQLRTRPRVNITVASGAARFARKIEVAVVKENQCR